MNANPEEYYLKKYMEYEKQQTRRDILLRAAYDLLKRSSQNYYVQPATDIEVFYDEANCDGWCLMEDIASELNLEDKDPIPLARD